MDRPTAATRTLRLLTRSAGIGAVAALQACVVVPRTIEVYDTECQRVARHMVLEEVQIAAIQHCANEGCVALIVAASAVTAATLIVSGTIAITSNVAYWVERKYNCDSGR